MGKNVDWGGGSLSDLTRPGPAVTGRAEGVDHGAIKRYFDFLPRSYDSFLICFASNNDLSAHYEAKSYACVAAKDMKTAILRGGGLARPSQTTSLANLM